MTEHTAKVQRPADQPEKYQWVCSCGKRGNLQGERLAAQLGGYSHESRNGGAS